MNKQHLIHVYYGIIQDRTVIFCVGCFALDLYMVIPASYSCSMQGCPFTCIECAHTFISAGILCVPVENKIVIYLKKKKINLQVLKYSGV